MQKKLISLFSGAGGMDIGFHSMGFFTAVAVEQDPSCCDTLRINMPDTPVIEGDIRSISTQEILELAQLK
ncbi:MAG: DNA cytosine methyltransferase, partial [Thiothrix sp.]